MHPHEGTFEMHHQEQVKDRPEMVTDALIKMINAGVDPLFRGEFTRKELRNAFEQKYTNADPVGSSTFWEALNTLCEYGMLSHNEAHDTYFIKNLA